MEIEKFYNPIFYIDLGGHWKKRIKILLVALIVVRHLNNPDSNVDNSTQLKLKRFLIRLSSTICKPIT